MSRKTCNSVIVCTFAQLYLQSSFFSIGSNGSTDEVKNDAYVCAIILTAVRLIASLSVSRWSRSHRRRSVYFTSAGLTILSLVFIATSVYFTKRYQIPSDTYFPINILKLLVYRDDLSDKERTVSYWVTLASTCTLAFCVQIGVQSMPHLLSGELYPGDLRANGKAISRAITCILIFLTLKVYLPLKNAITDYGVFYLYAGVILFSLPLVYFKSFCKKDDREEASNWFYMPETKGISLEEIRYFYTQRSVTSLEIASNIDI